jgi:coenzyme F420 biosynthesis associated uncharacterized protein
MRLVSAGPATTPGEAHLLVTDLRRQAVAAQGHVRELTGLDAPGGTSAVAVIDRPSWVAANIGGFQLLLEPLVDRLSAKRGTGGAVGAIGSRVTAVETGSLLAFLATKVLGQYELFSSVDATLDDGSSGAGAAVERLDATQGRLLLVAPNILAAEREMQVDPSDFRLWVCIHEETHRVQFGAVPWLRPHLLAEVHEFIDRTEVDPAQLVSRLRAVLGAAYDAVRADGPQAEAPSLLEAIQTPEQKEVLDRVTAVMSLLEGHADYVMDAVGPSVVPSVATIRARFQARRARAGRAESAVRRLIGLEAKLRQYRDGARFVSAVVERVGMSGFNAVWSEPAALPAKEELADPDAWVRRVHG